MQASTQALVTASAVLFDPATRAGKYLIFHLGSEEFGVEVMKVREILGLQEITVVPQVPLFVKGVINLRGKVVPVIDLRLKFALPPQEYTARTCIVIVRTHQLDEDLLIGMVVDGVVEVLNLAASDIEETPDFGRTVANPYLHGLAKIKGKVKILLDIDRVLSTHELNDLSALLP